MYVKSGRIRPVAHYLYAKGRKTRSRSFHSHAQRLPRGYKAQCVGELVQINQMSVTLHDGTKVKHFQAVCSTISGYAVKMVVQRADSETAATFLKKVEQEMPFLSCFLRRSMEEVNLWFTLKLFVHKRAYPFI